MVVADKTLLARVAGREPVWQRETGQRLKAAREAKGLSQTALGQELGVSFQQVQKYEQGVNRLGVWKLWLAADVLGVEVGWLVGVEGVKTSG